jgi:hypothetical protein
MRKVTLKGTQENVIDDCGEICGTQRIRCPRNNLVDRFKILYPTLKELG